MGSECVGKRTHKGNKETKIGGDVELYVVSRRVS